MTKVAFANSLACLFSFFKQRYLYFCLPNHSIAHSSLVRRSWQVTMPPRSACRGFSMPWTTECEASCPLYIPWTRAGGLLLSAPCSHLCVLIGIIFHAYGWQWCAKSIWEGNLSCPRRELTSLHKKAWSLLYTLKPLVYSAGLPHRFLGTWIWKWKVTEHMALWYCWVVVVGGCWDARAFHTLHLVAGWSTVPARTKLPTNFNRPSSTFLFLIFF